MNESKPNDTMFKNHIHITLEYMNLKKNMSVIGTMYAVYTQVPMTICFSRNGYLLNDSCSVNKLLLIQWIKYQYSVQERYMILNSSVHKL